MSDDNAPWNCPCCGGIASLERDIAEDDSGMFFVSCYQCRLRTKLYDTEALAVDAWERRAPDLLAENRRLREALELIEEHHGETEGWREMASAALADGGGR